MTKYLIMWFPMLLIAIVNGAMREAWFKKVISAQLAHQLSTLTLILLFACYMFIMFRKFPPASANQAVTVGIVWTIMTLLFEFGFGRWRGNSWRVLLSDYNIFQGRLWILVPLWVCIAPYLFYKFLSK